MAVKHVALLLAAAAVADCTYVYSSFWAPLLDPRILNYRVDAPFSPEAGRSARAQYEARYGPRGVNLIADLGNGKGPGDYVRDKAEQSSVPRRKNMYVARRDDLPRSAASGSAGSRLLQQ